MAFLNTTLPSSSPGPARENGERKTPASRDVCSPRVVWLIWLATVAALLVSPPDSRAAPPTEYQIKAAFLINFTRFIDWPADKLPRPDTPIEIGILGDDPFGSDIDAMARNNTAGGHPLRIVRLATLEEIGLCHIVYISESASDRVSRGFLEGLGEASVVTVSDIRDFAQAGGMIGFRMRDKKVRLDINNRAAERAGLKISSKLLNVARIVASDDRQ